MRAIKHIVQFSGGKDSTAMLLMMLERGMPIDDIIFCDTGMEFPEMYKHIDCVEQYIGRKVTKLKPPHSFVYYFAEYEKSRGKNKGNHGYGWPRPWMRWCTRIFKTQLTAEYLKEEGEYTLYIGIAYDEPKRHERVRQNTRHPLFEWGVTEKQALSYCYSRSFNWNGLYEQFQRVSCWCCPLQPLRSLRTLRKYHTQLWKKLLQMDTMVPYQFRPDWSVEALEQRFAVEDCQLSLF